MENGQTITCYSYDEYGYYKQPVLVQIEKNTPLMPPSVVEGAPALEDGYWYHINADDVWEAEAKPKNAQECIGIVVQHSDNTARGCELKKLMQNFCDEDSEHYKVKRGDDLSWSVEAIPKKTFAELQEEKLKTISDVAGQYDQYKCDSMFVISSVDGIKINSDARSQNNIRSLIEHYADEVTYKDFDNQYHKLNKTQLGTMLTECILNGEKLYQQKWQLQQAVSSATSQEELDAINVEFLMADFSA